jgi:hypothetical protein
MLYRVLLTIKRINENIENWSSAVPANASNILNVRRSHESRCLPSLSFFGPKFHIPDAFSKVRYQQDGLAVSIKRERPLPAFSRLLTKACCFDLNGNSG